MVVVALVVVAGAVAAGLALSNNPSSTSASGTTLPGTALSTTTTTSQHSAVTNVAVVGCPTTYGVNPPSTTTLPASLEVAGVPAEMVGHVAVYTDGLGILRVVAPPGWSCQANIDADGSGGLVVVPAGQSTTQPLATDQQAVTADQSSSCYTCRIQNE